MEACGNFPQASTGKTRDKVAAAIGMSGRTYEKAKVVVEAAESEPEKFLPVKEEMDRTGKVDPAYRQIRSTGNFTSALEEIERALRAVKKIASVRESLMSGSSHERHIAAQMFKRGSLSTTLAGSPSLLRGLLPRGSGRLRGFSPTLLQ